MAITKTIRPGLIQLRVTDLEASAKFYEEVLGLDVVGKTSDGRVMFKTYDEFDHHSVVLRAAPESGFDYVAFKVTDAETLEELKAATEAFGYPVDIASDEQPGYGKRYGELYGGSYQRHDREGAYSYRTQYGKPDPGGNDSRYLPRFP